MTLAEMFALNPVLTLLGVAVVIGILVIIVIRLDRANKAALALEENKNVPVQAAAEIPASVPAVTVNDAAITAAITAAINEYRKTNT